LRKIEFQQLLPDEFERAVHSDWEFSANDKEELN